MKGTPLALWMNGYRVGTWLVTEKGKHSFSYHDEWLERPEARPISLSLPLRESSVPYEGELVEHYFGNLLPDNEAILKRIQKRFHTKTVQPFDLLREIGRDCVGAVMITPEDESPEGVTQIDAVPRKEAEIAKLLRANTREPVFGLPETEDFRISIAGAQEKTGFLYHNGEWCTPKGATPTTHIFKLPLGTVTTYEVDLSTSVENEWLCLEILKAYGLPTAESEILQFEDQKVLSVTRFDRKLSKDNTWWIRVPTEDMCQVFGLHSSEKYEKDGGPGIKRIMDQLLSSSSSEQDRKNFFSIQICFWLLGAPDGHAKNFSVFIEPLGLFRLTPFYDVISALPILGKKANQLPKQKLDLAMAVSGKNKHYRWSEIFLRHYEKEGKSVGIAAQELASALINKTDNVIQQVTTRLPQEFPQEVADKIFKGLKENASRLAKEL
ncbi:type II toxin-antitoxin system HipA family toxin [bacterium]|nr:type II toxin-antitoxin system HipA family toxin [bacterium]